MHNNNFIVNEDHPICLHLFGENKIFTDIDSACSEASWAMNRQVYPFEIERMITNGEELTKYRY